MVLGLSPLVLLLELKLRDEKTFGGVGCVLHAPITPIAASQSNEVMIRIKSARPGGS